uniref:Transposase n=1 Tax=Angiostrongylus cantonensis TaxID=6313 RepID=A0A0K0D9W4_ANGCA
MSLLSQNFTRDQTTVSFVQDFIFRGKEKKTTTNWDLLSSLVGCWEGAVVDNIDEEYDRHNEHLHVSAMKAESSKVLELIRQHGIVRAAGNREVTSELAKQCRQAIKDDLKMRRAVVMAEAIEAGKSIRKARRSFANYKNKMTVLRRPYGTVIASRKATEKIIHEYYSDIFDSRIHLSSYNSVQKGNGENHPRFLLRSLR